MPEVVERKFKGDTVKLDILRDKKPMTRRRSSSARSGLILCRATATMFGRVTSFTAASCFSRSSLDLIEAYQPTDIRDPALFRLSSSPNKSICEHPEVIILTNILPDPINTYLAPYRASIVDEINGKKIRTLDDLAKAFAETPDRFVVQHDRRRTAAGARSERSGSRAGANQDALQRRLGTKPGRTAGQPNAGRSRTKADAMRRCFILALIGVRFLPLASGLRRRRKRRRRPETVVKPKELSLVRVNVTGQPYDYLRPWQKKAPFSKRALGAVLPQGRVLVTADLVANQNYVELERAESGEKTAPMWWWSITKRTSRCSSRPIRNSSNGLTPLATRARHRGRRSPRRLAARIRPARLS